MLSGLRQFRSLMSPRWNPQHMRYPYCWVGFDVASKEGRNHPPVKVPYQFGHIFGRDCLFELVLKTDEDPTLCPRCREGWLVSNMDHWENEAIAPYFKATLSVQQ